MFQLTTKELRTKLNKLFDNALDLPHSEKSRFFSGVFGRMQSRMDECDADSFAVLLKSLQADVKRK